MIAASTTPDLLRLHPVAALPWIIAAVLLAVAAAWLWTASRSAWDGRAVIFKLCAGVIAVIAAGVALAGLYALSHVLLVLAIVVSIILVANYSAR